MLPFCLKYILGFLVFVLVLIICPTPVYATRTIDSATVNGSTSVTVLPSASITAQVNATLSGGGAGDDWGSTSYQIGSGSTTCVNHANITNSGTFSESFTITAPSSNGTYDVSFIIWQNDACSSGASSTFTLTGGIIVAIPTPTPTPGPGTPTATPTPTSSSSSSSSSTYYPSVSLNSYSPNPTHTVPLTFVGLAAIGQGTIAHVEYTLTDGSTWIPAQPVDGSFNGKDEQFSFTTSSLPEGIYTVKVRAKSGAGVFTQEGSYVLQTVTVATTPPHVTLDTISPNPTKNQTPTLTARATAKLVDIGRVEISIDGGKSWQPTRRSGSAFTLTLTKLDDGNYPAIARAFDRAGNVGQSGEQTLIIDTIPPIIGGGMESLGPQILTPDKNGRISVVSGTDITIAISMKGGVTAADIRTDSTTFVLSPIEGTHLWASTVTFRSGGEKSLTVSAVDGAGNTSQRVFNTLNVEHAGMVYDKKTNQAVEGADVTVYVFENMSAQWIPWEAQSYGQHNPQQINASGSYSFMVPAGKYYIEAKAAGYNTLQSEIMTFSQTSIIHYPLALTSRPKLEFTLPFVGKVVLALPSFSPPETFRVPEETGTPPGNPSGSDIGKPAPDFSFPNLENKHVRLASFKGKKILLSFMGPWSPPSLEQASLLSAAASEVSEDQAILVVMLQESLAATQTLMNNSKYVFPVIADADGTTAGKYNVTLLPHHVFIDEAGRIQGTFTGLLTKEDILKKLTNVP